MLTLFSYGSSLHWACMDNSGEVADKRSAYILSLRRYIKTMQGKYLYILVTNCDSQSDLKEKRAGIYLFIHFYFFYIYI